jgi:hypothetical protein
MPTARAGGAPPRSRGSHPPTFALYVGREMLIKAGALPHVPKNNTQRSQSRIPFFTPRQPVSTSGVRVSPGAPVFACLVRKLRSGSTRLERPERML